MPAKLFLAISRKALKVEIALANLNLLIMKKINKKLATLAAILAAASNPGTPWRY
ncbi:MAG: hypothetical protein WCN88_03360 [Candidatus Falkowbacteria bacterium]